MEVIGRAGGGIEGCGMTASTSLASDRGDDVLEVKSNVVQAAAANNSGERSRSFDPLPSTAIAFSGPEYRPTVTVVDGSATIPAAKQEARVSEKPRRFSTAFQHNTGSSRGSISFPRHQRLLSNISRHSIFDAVSSRMSRSGAGKSDGVGNALRLDDLGHVNRAHVAEPVLPSLAVRRRRRKEIEEKFGKKRSRGSVADGENLDPMPETSLLGGAGEDNRFWAAGADYVFHPAGSFSYWWSIVVGAAFLYNFWVIIYRFAFEGIIYLFYRICYKNVFILY